MDKLVGTQNVVKDAARCRNLSPTYPRHRSMEMDFEAGDIEWVEDEYTRHGRQAKGWIDPYRSDSLHDGCTYEELKCYDADLTRMYSIR